MNGRRILSFDKDKIQKKLDEFVAKDEGFLLAGIFGTETEILYSTGTDVRLNTKKLEENLSLLTKLSSKTMSIMEYGELDEVFIGAQNGSSVVVSIEGMEYFSILAVAENISPGVSRHQAAMLTMELLEIL